MVMTIFSKISEVFCEYMLFLSGIEFWKNNGAVTTFSTLHQLYLYNSNNTILHQSIMSSPIFVRKRTSLTIPSSLNQKCSPIKAKICQEYLPKYRKNLKLSNKKISDSSEDRLSELTTKQIDRLIEMEKIKNLLNENKKGIKPTHISFVDCTGTHPNVYQPNFIAKINRIALERNVRHLRSEEFDEAMLSHQEIRKRGLDLQQKNLRFVKQYRSDNRKCRVESYEDIQEKSIDSINEELESFEEALECRKSSQKVDSRERERQKNQKQRMQKYRQKQTNILSMTRWFNGMSTFYLNLDKPNAGLSKNRKAEDRDKYKDRPSFDRNFDLEHENSYLSRIQRNYDRKCSTKMANSRLSTVA